MDAVESLLQISDISIRIQQRKEQLDELQSISYSISAFRYDSEHVSSSATADKIANAIARIDDIKNSLTDEMLHLTEVKANIISVIEKIRNPAQKKVLLLRYVRLDDECRPLQLHVIADMLHYSYRQILRIHESGLEEYVRLSSNVT